MSVIFDENLKQGTSRGSRTKIPFEKLEANAPLYLRVKLPPARN
jgi:hypothetical protein